MLNPISASTSQETIPNDAMKVLHLGRALRAARLKLDLTQEQLAERAGVDVRTVQRAERGDGLAPFTLKCLAPVLHTTTEALVEAAARPVTAPPARSPGTDTGNVPVESTGSLLDDPALRERRRRREECVLSEVRDARGLEVALRGRVTAYSTAYMMTAREGHPAPTAVLHRLKDFVMRLLLLSPVDVDSAHGPDTLLSLEADLRKLHATGYACFMGPTRHAERMVTLVIDDGDDARRGILLQDRGPRLYWAGDEPDPDEEFHDGPPDDVDYGPPDEEDFWPEDDQ